MLWPGVVFSILLMFNRCDFQMHKIIFSENCPPCLQFLSILVQWGSMGLTVQDKMWFLCCLSTCRTHATPSVWQHPRHMGCPVSKLRYISHCWAQPTNIFKCGRLHGRFTQWPLELQMQPPPVKKGNTTMFCCFSLCSRKVVEKRCSCHCFQKRP